MQIKKRRPPGDGRSTIDAWPSTSWQPRAATADCWKSTGELVIEELEERCVPGGTVAVKLSRKTAGWGC
jgi:hypothetical protein